MNRWDKGERQWPWRRGVAVMATLAAAVAWVTRGLWSPAEYWQAHDSVLHLYRTFALDLALRQGVLYPRWLPDLAYGYGYPILNYYPPLSTYLVEAVHLFGLALPEAVKAVFVLIVALAAAGAYRMGREIWRGQAGATAAGLVTALAYILFPYFILDIYARGAIAEGLAMALLPWLFWALRRSLARGTLGALALVALFQALVVESHSLTLVIAAPVLVGYVLLELRRMAAGRRLRALAETAGATAVAAALTAIYWLPLVLEMRLVRMGNGLEAIDEAWRTSFVPLAGLVQDRVLYQYGQAPFGLGLAAVVLGSMALLLVVVLRVRIREFGLVLFFAAFTAVAALAMSEPARGLWLAFGFLDLVQFVWRLSLLVGLGLAVVVGALPPALAGWAVRGRPEDVRLARLVVIAPAAIAVLVAATLAVTSTLALEPELLTLPQGDITLARLAQLEVFTQNAGTTTWGEYLPASVTVPDFIKYKAPAGGPAPEARIELASYGATAQAFTVSASVPVSVTLHAFAFPGWQATLDRVPVPVYASTPAGLQTIDAPAGAHRIQVTLTQTGPQWTGALISGIAALLVVIGIGLGLGRREPLAVAALAVAALAAFAFALPMAVAVAARAVPVQPESVDVASTVRLIGLQVGDGTLAADGWHIADGRTALHLRAYWHVRAAGLPNTPIAWRLVDESGRVASRRAQLPRYGTSTQQSWVPNEIVPDDYDLSLVAVPNGRYVLEVAYGGDGAFVEAARVVLERVPVPTQAEPSVTHRADAVLGDEIRLVGYNPRQEPAAGRRFKFDLIWEARRDVHENLTEFVQLLDRDGRIVAQHDGQPGEGLLPALLWMPGEPVVETRYLDLPSDLAPGTYRLVVGLYRYPAMTRLPVITADGPSPDDQVELGVLKIPMNAQAARPEHALAVSFGPAIQLLGYDLQTSPAQMLLKLHWQARARVDTDYTVFVHIVDAAGQVVAQQDGMPAENRYPTRIWEAGERVVDTHALPLDLAPGRYRIVIGMYAPETGERLPAFTANGQALPDRQVDIGSFEVNTQ